METKNLIWRASKNFVENGEKYTITVTAKLADECKNGHCDFSITADIVRIARNGRLVLAGGGCCHEEIAKHFPELRKFLHLHLCNYLGMPTYPEANGQYFVAEGKEKATEYLRLQDGEFDVLAVAKDEAERPYFKYLLFSLGIVERWQSEANEFIAFLEEKTGNNWDNPYNEETERNVMKLNQQETDEITDKITAGYYSKERIQARAKLREIEKIEKERAKILERYEKDTEKARKERDVALYILDSGLKKNNWIYYDFKNTVAFNWRNYGEKITQEEFADFINKVDYSKLPEGIEFCLK